MWWEAGDEDPEVVDEIGRLKDLLQEDDHAPGEFLGVGSTIIHGRRFPLIVLHESLFLRSRLRKFRIKSLTAEIKHILRLKPFDMDGNHTTFGKEALSGLGDRLLMRYKICPKTRLMFIGWPRPYALPSGKDAAFEAGTRLGTLGLGLCLPARGWHSMEHWSYKPAELPRVLVTTAGHVIGADANGKPRPASVAWRRRWWQKGRQADPIGRVVSVADPIGPAGADVAYIEIFRSAFPSGFVHAPAALAVPPMPEASIATLLGGKSGNRRGWVDNPLPIIRTAGNGERQWTNCWTIFEVGGGFAQPGDSGGLVVDERGEVVGHLVASMGVITHHGRRQAGLVQDVHTILAEAPSAWSGSAWPFLISPRASDRTWLGRLRGGLVGW